MAPREVLIISNPEDEHTVRVAEHLRKRGVHPILYYPENFGTQQFLTLRQMAQAEEKIVVSHSRGNDIWTEDVYSIWYRRPRSPLQNQMEISDEASEFARNEWVSALDATYTLLDKPLWVSHPDKLKIASRKPFQLKVAQHLGLTIPHTLITNNPQEVRRFYDTYSGKVIIKATGRGWVYSKDSESVHFVLTNRLRPEDIRFDDEISLAPATFQEEIPKEYEIRVNVVGQRILAIRIDSQQSAISELDWRRYDVAHTPYTPYELPTEVARKCLKLTQFLGLEFGAIDLIRKPTGEYVFLEINGNGQFLWAEQLSGVKVSEAIAELLAGESLPLKFAQL